MLVRLDSPAGDATLFVMSQGGMYFLRPGIAASWRGSLPRSGEYFLGIYGGAVPTDYVLSAQLATRIRFKEGEHATTIAGNTPDGAIASFSVFGVKGDKMAITLSGAGGRAALGVFGFVDDQTYLAASDNQRSLKLTLPVTQDYIIEIVPLPGEAIDFILDVQVE